MTGSRIVKIAGMALAILVGAAILAREPLMTVLASSPPGCPDVLLIGARGSGEPDSPATHGLGPTVDAFSKPLEEALNARSVSYKHLLVVYAAADVKVLKPTDAELAILVEALRVTGGNPGAIAAFAVQYYAAHLSKFLASIEEGITSGMDELRTEAAQCTRTKFVLAGYSQGAMAWHQTLLRLDRQQSPLLDRVVATVLIADGDRKRETAATRFGTAKFAGEGIRSALTVGEQDIPSSKASSTFDICNAGDLVCDFSLPLLRHTDDATNVHTHTYATGPLLANIARRVADLVAAPQTQPSPVAQGHDCEAFVADVTIPDDTAVQAGSTFTKTWHLRNCGTTDWSHLTAVRTDGTMTPSSFAVPRTAPGGVATVSVSLRAPDSPGRSRTTYRLRAADGHFADNSFWVQIIVTGSGTPASQPAPPASRPASPRPPAPANGTPPPATDPGQIPLPAGARTLGGIDLDRYCGQWGLHAKVRYPVAWGWRCSTSTVDAAGLRVGDQDISVDDACAQQYQANAKSHYRDYADPYSWFCWAAG
jgi:hypothetical protein